MALSRAEISRRYRKRHPKRQKESAKLTNEKRKRRIRRQKEIETLNEILILSQ